VPKSFTNLQCHALPSTNLSVPNATVKKQYRTITIMSSSESKDEQIPSRQNENQTQRMTEKQNQVAGERREKEVSDLPRAAAIGQALIGMNFPADKNKITEHIRHQSQTNPDCEKMIPVLEKIEDRQYSNAADVTQAAGLVQ
jgi:hypothetical protein